MLNRNSKRKTFYSTTLYLDITLYVFHKPFPFFDIQSVLLTILFLITTVFTFGLITLSFELAALQPAETTTAIENVEATTKALDEKKEQLKNLKKIIDNANNIKLANKSKFENYGKQESENTDIGRSDSNGAEGRTMRGGQGDVGKETPINSMVYGVALTREEFDRSYKDYDPRELLRNEWITAFHAGITDVNSFEGYTPDDNQPTMPIICIAFSF